jgi:hypothetical protein
MDMRHEDYEPDEIQQYREAFWLACGDPSGKPGCGRMRGSCGFGFGGLIPCSKRCSLYFNTNFHSPRAWNSLAAHISSSSSRLQSS